MPVPLLAVLLATPLLAPQTGVVVRVDRPAHLVAVADATGQVELVHVERIGNVAAGARVGFTARQLRNGTLATTTLTVSGRLARASVDGVVLAADAHRRSFTVSARGAVLVLRLAQPARKKSRALARPTVALPAVGSEVNVTFGVGGHGERVIGSVTPVTPSASAGAFEGVVAGRPGATLRVVAGNGAAVTLRVPAGLDLSQLRAGDRVLAYFDRQTDGSLLLTAVAADGSAGEADDDAGIVGDVDAARGNLDGSDDECTVVDDPAAGGDPGGTSDDATADGSDDQADDPAAADDDTDVSPVPACGGAVDEGSPADDGTSTDDGGESGSNDD
jgi:hypothetical protein